MLAEIARLDLVAAVSPIQYAIRLLIPQASRMLELEDIARASRRFDPQSLTHVWGHADPRVDALQQDLERLVGVAGQPRRATTSLRRCGTSRMPRPAARRAESAAPRARRDPVSQRALVLLSGAHHRAGRSDMRTLC